VAGGHREGTRSHAEQGNFVITKVDRVSRAHLVETANVCGPHAGASHRQPYISGAKAVSPSFSNLMFINPTSPLSTSIDCLTSLHSTESITTITVCSPLPRERHCRFHLLGIASLHSMRPSVTNARGSAMQSPVTLPLKGTNPSPNLPLSQAHLLSALKLSPFTNPLPSPSNQSACFELP